MIPAKPYPSLTAKGWLFSPQEKADYIVTSAFLTDYSQSYIYNGNLFSPQKVYQAHSEDIPRLIEVLRLGFEQVLGRYFEFATVTIIETTDPKLTNKVKLEMRCDIIDGGKEYQLGKLIGSNGSKFQILTDYINEGIKQ